MTARTLLSLVALLGSHLAAQDTVNPGPNALPDAPLPVAAATFEPTSQPQPQSARVMDKKFFFVMGALAGSESFRYTTRKLVVEHEYAEGAPWITRVPSNPPMVAKNLALFGSEFLVAYELKKPHSWLPGDRVIRKLWWVYPTTMTVIHVKNAVGNINTTGPGGCTSIECASQIP